MAYDHTATASAAAAYWSPALPHVLPTGHSLVTPNLLEDSEATAKWNATNFKLDKVSNLVQFSFLQLQCPPGMYVAPSPIDPLQEWQGILFIREGFYQGAVFTFVLTFTSSYPSTPPAIRFTPPSAVYHPLVHSTTGELDMELLVPDWSSPDWNAVSLLGVVKNMFYQRRYFTCGGRSAEPQEVAKNAKWPNDEAHRHFTEDPKQFLDEVLKCVECSQSFYRSQSLDADDSSLQPFEAPSIFKFGGAAFNDLSTRRYRSALTTALTAFASSGEAAEEMDTSPEIALSEWVKNVYAPSVNEGRDLSSKFEGSQEGGEANSSDEGNFL